MNVLLTSRPPDVIKFILSFMEIGHFPPVSSEGKTHFMGALKTSLIAM
jgi:hypothetical protein